MDNTDITITPLRKAAILLLNLEMDKNGSTKAIFQALGEDLSKQILLEMTKLGKIEPKDTESIVNEFYGITAGKAGIFGGETIPNDIFTRAFHQEASSHLFKDHSMLFNFLIPLNNEQIMDYFKQESYQCVAMILYFLPETKVADLLDEFSDEQRMIVTELMCQLDIPNYNLLWDLHDHLAKTVFAVESRSDESVEKLARSLEIMAPDKRDAVMESFEAKSPTMFRALQKTMFLFEDLIRIEGRLLTSILYALNIQTLAKALRGCPQEFIAAIKEDKSERFVSMLDEELSLLEDLPDELIQVARREVVREIRGLEAQGKIAPLVKSKIFVKEN